jgi:hypothetical protein
VRRYSTVVTRPGPLTLALRSESSCYVGYNVIPLKVLYRSPPFTFIIFWYCFKAKYRSLYMYFNIVCSVQGHFSILFVALSLTILFVKLLQRQPYVAMSSCYRGADTHRWALIRYFVFLLPLVTIVSQRSLVSLSIWIVSNK